MEPGGTETYIYKTKINKKMLLHGIKGNIVKMSILLRVTTKLNNFCQNTNSAFLRNRKAIIEFI